MGFWDLRFRRNLQNWEVNEFPRLRTLIHKQCEPINRPDALSWKLRNNKVFSVKSIYEKLLVRMDVSFSYDLVSIPKVLRKVCFSHGWLLRGDIDDGRILGKERLFVGAAYERVELNMSMIN